MRSTVVVALLGALIGAGGASATAARPGTRVIRYLGARLVVPVGWPVFDLARTPTTCVRFDRHAVYLGLPSARQLCPPHVAGRTEAILVEPPGAAAARDRSVAGAALAPAVAGAARASGDELVRTVGAATVVATWGSRPRLIQQALGLTGRLTPVRAAMPMHTALAASGPTGGGSPSPGSGTTTPSTSTAGQVYTGYGFDACSAPSESQLSAWSASPFRAVGIYIGGANMACTQSNLTATWVSDEAAAGWHMIPIYVGLQAPGNSCGCAAFTLATATADGTAAALDAVSHAQALGLGPGNPIYLDLEAYTRGGNATQAALDFVGAWTSQLHSSGYLSGVYSSDDSGIVDLVSEYGTGFTEPDDLWFASWNDQATTTDSAVPSTEWASHQRLHQYRGGHVDDYGGATIDIDSDYLDALTAGPGTTTLPPPSLSVAPTSNGAIDLRPSWKGGPAVSSWQLLAGADPSSLTPAAAPVSASSSAPLVVHSAYRYFAVSALGANGSNLATSAPVPTPAHLALAGSSVFVPTAGLGGVPVSCFNSVPCHVSTTISIGRKRLVTTGTEHVPVGGGLVFFSLPNNWRQRLFAAAHDRLAVTVSLRDISGLTTSGAMNLVGFSTSGRAPARTSTASPSAQVVGLTDYVSHGWVGGILTACAADVPCHIALTLNSGRTVLGRTGSEYLGAHELGYLVFTLTAAGHAALTHASGNQLGVQVTAVNGSDSASARVVLVSFG